MTSNLVFNHHSLPFAVPSDADKAIPDFLKVCIKERTLNNYRILLGLLLISCVAKAFTYQQYENTFTSWI